MRVSKLDTTFLSISNQVFVIPVYQRNYDWKLDNCKQLFQDIEDIVGRNKKHFIGTVCTKLEGRWKTVIIDGQQRITSLMLLFKAIYDECDDPVTKDRIKNQYLQNPYPKTEEDKIKLKPIKKDIDIYNKLIKYDYDDQKFDAFTDIEKDSNVFKNYQFFRGALNNKIKDGKYTLEEFIDALERLELVELVLEDENPQVIFESLNSTGLSLTNSDLLRNYLLMSLDYSEQERLYTQYWHEIEKLIGSDNIEQFMVHYLIFRRETDSIIQNGKKAKVSGRTLYYAFKKYYSVTSDIKEIEEIFKDMYKCAKFYKHFIFTHNINFSNLSLIDRALYELFFLIGEKPASILVMYLFEILESNEITEEEFIECIRICISYSFRARICGTTSFSTQFAPLAIQRLKNLSDYKTDFIDKFWQVITSGKGKQSFQNNEQFRKALIENEIYTSMKSSGTKYLLYTIEKNGSLSKELPPFSGSTIEHVVPQTLTKRWAAYLEEKNDIKNYESNLHRLGNLALTNYNSELSNKDFEEKKKILSNSNYENTRSIATFTDWTSAQILKRSVSLADKALKVWFLKDGISDERSIDTGKTYDLTADFDSFSGLKPSFVGVCDEEIEVSNWSDFLVFTARKFYEKNPLIMDELAKNQALFPGNKQVISHSCSDMRRYGEVGGNWYILTNFDSQSILECIEAIANIFDKKFETNYKEDIWFTIKNPNPSL